MTALEIKERLKRGERIVLECKKAESELPKSFWETYSAFANTVGGLVLLGVEENRKEKDIAKKFTFTGVKNPAKIISDLWNTINSNKVSHNILRDEDVDSIEVDGVTIVYVSVPQADWRDKPIYLNENPYKGTFRRNNEGDYHCTQEEIKAMIRDSNADGNDGSLIELYDMRDIDLESLRQYRTEFRLENPDHVWNNDGDKEFLKKIGGYVEDRKSGKEGLTAAGLLMFGQGLPIRDRFANFRMDYIDFSNLIGDERYHDRLTYDGRWENNIYQFLRRTLMKLTMDIPKPFKMEGVKRIDDTPQHKAVREAFTNAIIHADVFLEGGILRIEKHDDKLCLRNPGTLMLTIDQIYSGGVSRARNPRMQNMLRMIGFGENLGSGFQMILNAWSDAGWDAPQLNNRLDIDEVELVLPLRPKDISQTSQTSEKTSEKTSKKTSKKTSETILGIISENPRITVKELSQLTGLSVGGVRWNLDKLADKGQLKRVGPDKGGYWEVINKE